MYDYLVNLSDQLADVFVKSPRGPRIKYICNKLGAFDLYASALRGVLRIIKYYLDILWFFSYILCTLSSFILHFILFPFCSILLCSILLYIYRCLYTV